ncbi:MAG: KH domain-containing protein [archaeon]
MDDILLMNALEKVTGVAAKDCLIEGQLVSYFVPEKEMGKAIGKAAINIKTLEQKLNKRVEIVAYCEKAEDVFAKALEVNYTGSKVNGGRLIVSIDGASKSKAFKNNARIKRVKELIKRNFGLDLVIA